MPPKKYTDETPAQTAARLARNAKARARYAAKKAPSLGASTAVKVLEEIRKEKEAAPPAVKAATGSEAVALLKKMREEKPGFVAKEEKLASRNPKTAPPAPPEPEPRKERKKTVVKPKRGFPPVAKEAVKKAKLKKLTKAEEDAKAKAKREAEEAKAAADAETRARVHEAELLARAREAETRARLLAESKKATEAVRPVPPPPPAPAPKTTMTEGQPRVETLAGGVEVDEEFLALLGLKGKKARLEAEAKAKAEAPPPAAAAPPPAPAAPEKKKRMSKEEKRAEGIRQLEAKIVNAEKSKYGISPASYQYFYKEAGKLGLKPKQFVSDVLAARHQTGRLVLSSGPGETATAKPDLEADERIRQARARLSAAGGGSMIPIMTGFTY